MSKAKYWYFWHGHILSLNGFIGFITGFLKVHLPLPEIIHISLTSPPSHSAPFSFCHSYSALSSQISWLPQGPPHRHGNLALHATWIHTTRFFTIPGWEGVCKVPSGIPTSPPSSVSTNRCFPGIRLPSLKNR